MPPNAKPVVGELFQALRIDPDGTGVAASAMSIEERLQELGIVLPKANPPAAVYCPDIQVGKLVFTAGQTPEVDGILQYIVDTLENKQDMN